MQSKATCARDLLENKAQARRFAWSPAGLPTALTAAVQLLQQHPRLAAAPALSSKASHGGQRQLQQRSRQARWCGPCSTSHSIHKQQQHQHHQQQQQHAISSPAWLVCCTADSAAAAAAQATDPALAGTRVSGAAEAPSPAAASPAGQQTANAGERRGAAAALARLQQAMQRKPVQPPAPNPPQMQASHPQHLEASSTGSSSSSSVRRVGQLYVQPQRPALDAAAAAAAQEAQQQQQQQQPRQERLLAWRSHGKARIAAAMQEQLGQQQQQARQHLDSAAGDVQHHHHQQQQQQRGLPAPPLEPSIVGGRAYLTSPVSFVAAGTLTRRLAGSISTAFAVHQHQLMFAVGPLPLGVAVKALATARRMMGEGEGGVPVNILMQPTLRGGRTPMRCQSYALDITRVGALPMQPGVAGRQAVAPTADSSSSSSSSAEDGARFSIDGEVQQQHAVPWAVAKVVHITSSSNELAAARSLVENMPARGQTVMRAMGPHATETAVLALSLARPLMQARHGQDLAAVVLWNEQQQQRAYRPGRETGLLLAVFRCEAGSFPPRVLLLPPSRRNLKRREFWQQKTRRTAAVLPSHSSEAVSSSSSSSSTS